MTTAIYNEIDPYAAQWLRNLIAAGHIAPGVVDERRVESLDATDVAGSGQRHFFAGIAGWSLALRLAGVPDDADVWTGSCPCQPFSDAGRGGGFYDERHLWPAWFRLIRECRPPVVFGEQVASRAGLAWLDLVFADMEGAGYACAAADLPAAGVGAPHRRQRLFFVAYAALGASGKDGKAVSGNRVRDVSCQTSERRTRRSGGGGSSPRSGCAGDGWVPEPSVCRVVNGLPNAVGQLRAYGNAIVPQVAAAFIRAALEAVP